MTLNSEVVSKLDCEDPVERGMLFASGRYTLKRAIRMPPSDECVQRAIRGDNDALETLLRDVAPQVHARIAVRIRPIWQSVLDAEDILQVTYLEVFLRVRNFEPRGDGAFLAWVTRIAENNLLDAIRALKRAKRPPIERRVRPTDDVSVVLYEQVMRTSSTASRHLARNEALHALEQGLQNLPADYAQVVRRYHLDGVPVGEVAKELKRSEGAVYMLLARALDRLRELLCTDQTKTGETA